ncbi:MAG TPA: phospholipid carrier-dependent glycosyltransferase [Pirellulaceae bacterium]|nr:phospholipid carrier-dependent glycosyltransferase [Pirellulaceae bacterium]
MKAWILAGVFIAIHVGLLAWSAWVHSPTADEPAHLAAGISHWYTGRFRLYCVNPPLVRLVASAPTIAMRPAIDLSSYDDSPGMRREFEVGQTFFERNRLATCHLMTVSRWACLPFSLLGAVISFIWAKQLFGPGAGVLSTLLWCICPNLLAYGSLIVPDAAATAFGLAAVYTFWRWMRCASWDWALVGGVTLGLAQLCKTTWILLFAIYPVLWIVRNWPLTDKSWSSARTESLQWTVMMLLAILVVNLGYGFEGSFHRLGSYEFVSQTLGNVQNPSPVNIATGNRFQESVLAHVPVPLPKPYVDGVDLQKWDFDRRLWSYLAGEWRHGGWPHYYLYALAVKVPVGIWLLGGIAVYTRFRSMKDGIGWRDEFIVLAPALAIVAFVSAQTGFNHHVRYVLPALPFFFIWISGLARCLELRHRILSRLVTVAMVAAIISSLSCYPHSLSYFNEIVGGPRKGHAHLVDSNVDWGQDLLFLKRWLRRNPDCDQISVAYFPSDFDLANLHISAVEPPKTYSERQGHLMRRSGPYPGWHAISVNRIRSRTREYDYFLALEPVAMAGYSVYIYRVTLPEANRVRKELGLKLLNEDDRKERVP